MSIFEQVSFKNIVKHPNSQHATITIENIPHVFEFCFLNIQNSPCKEKHVNEDILSLDYFYNGSIPDVENPSVEIAIRPLDFYTIEEECVTLEPEQWMPIALHAYPKVNFRIASTVERLKHEALCIMDKLRFVETSLENLPNRASVTRFQGLREKYKQDLHAIGYSYDQINVVRVTAGTNLADDELLDALELF